MAEIFSCVVYKNKKGSLFSVIPPSFRSKLSLLKQKKNVGLYPIRWCLQPLSLSMNIYIFFQGEKFGFIPYNYIVIPFPLKLRSKNIFEKSYKRIELLSLEFSKKKMNKEKEIKN